MNLTDKVSIPTQVMARDVGTETVILNLESGIYFGLDPVGARIWQLMGEGKTLAEVCDAMVGEYAVERSDLEHDVLDLAEKLAAQGLIVTA
jgi:hypothetical protein